MKALIVEHVASAGPQLVCTEMPTPTPKPSELLVRVEMAGLNRADLALATDHYSVKQVAGSELVGEVVAVSENCDGFAIGDRIMALSKGAFAEYACVDSRLALQIPLAVDWPIAAALPAWYMTAHDALVTQGELRAGESVMIQGVTTGVGQAAAQLARLRKAGRVIGVARSASKLGLLTDVEVDHRILMNGDCSSSVKQATDGKGVDLVIDMVGGGALACNIDSLSLRGRLIAVGRLGGASDTLDIGMLALKRLRIVGVTFRTRSVEEKSAVALSFAEEVLPYVVTGEIKPRIDRIFPLMDASSAQQMMRRNEHFGKVLLKIR